MVKYPQKLSDKGVGMFGYVQPLKSELKVKEFALYRGYYCGVCKALGRLYGQVSRFTVTYDAAFLALINSALVEGEESIALEKCVVNPFKAKPVVRKDLAISYAVALNLIMAYYKLKDGWRDEKSVLSLLASWILSPSARRIKAAYPGVCEAVAEQLGRLAALESREATQKQWPKFALSSRLAALEAVEAASVDKVGGGHHQQCLQPFQTGAASIDEAADPFAKLISLVLPAPHVQSRQRRVMEWLGYNLGKWVYIVDAYSDIESDIASGSYNVLVARYGKDALALFTGSATSHIGKQRLEKMNALALLSGGDPGYICKQQLEEMDVSVLLADGGVASHRDEGNVFDRWRGGELHSRLKEEEYGGHIMKGNHVGRADDAASVNEGRENGSDGQDGARGLVCCGVDNGGDDTFARQYKIDGLYQKGEGKSLAAHIREESRSEVEFILY